MPSPVRCAAQVGVEPKSPSAATIVPARSELTTVTPNKVAARPSQWMAGGRLDRRPPTTGMMKCAAVPIMLA
jgi:hypothetical protein